MTIGTFINKLNSIKDHNSSVYFNYGSEYPAVKIVIGSDPFKNEACVVIKNCNVNERKQVLTIQDLINKFGLIKSLSKDALVYIEAFGYKGLPEEVNSIKEYNLSNNFKKVIISNSKEAKVDPEYAEYLRLKKKFESKVN
jgi:hypothetical protein